MVKAITDSYAKGSGGTGAVRAKASKNRPKLDNTIFQDPGQQQIEEGAEEESAKTNVQDRLAVQSKSVGIATPANDPGLNELPQISPTLTPAPRDPPRPPPPPIPVERTGSDSDHEIPHKMFRSMSESHPELEIKEQQAWTKTIERRLFRKMTKPERERQNIIHELLLTERHHFRALHVLNLVFKQHISELVSEETLAQLFPELDSLIEISCGFLNRLEQRKGNENAVVHDISDILLEEYTGANRERILAAFGGFCSSHLIAGEMYKELMKKKNFNRLMQELYRLKECQRLTLPDYYTGVSQRLAKMVQFLQRLVKRTDALKLDHAERLRKSYQELTTLVTDVDQAVEDRKNLLELKAIQDKLEVNFPRSSAKNFPLSFPLKEMTELNLTAQNRRLIKRGDAMLMHGHGKQLRKCYFNCLL